MKFECHGHIIADGVSYADAMARHKYGIDEADVRKNLKAVAARGVAFYRDGGDKYMVSSFAKKIAGAYGIDYRTPIYMTHKNGCYGAMYGRGFDNMWGFLKLVREAKAAGADFIKIAATGMLDFNGAGNIMGPPLPIDELKEAVKIADGEGFSVMAHVNGADNIKNALEAGVGSVEHGLWPDRGVIDYFLQTNAVWVPTCAAVFNLITAGRYPGHVLRNIYETQKTVLMEAYLRGVLIASGSDCGAFMVGQGTGTEDEIAILKGMGINPERGNKVIAERFLLH